MWRLVLLLYVLPAAAGWAVSYHLTGSLGEAAGGQMILSVTGAAVAGSAWDESISERQTLRGTVAGGTATVTASGGAPGAYAGTLSADGRRFTGEWTSADGETTLPFRFAAVAQYHTTTATAGRLTQTAGYPVFLSAGPAWRALNATVAELVAGTQRRFRAELPPAPPPEGTAYFQDVKVEIAYADTQLVSLLITQEFYTGGAHPGLTYRSANYLMTGPRPRLLSLVDLFDPRGGYQAMLLELVVADINAQKADRGGAPPVPGTFSLRDITVYTLSPYALTFHFAPSVAGAYAEGPYAVLFPYGSITEYLHPRGPLMRFAEGM